MKNERDKTVVDLHLDENYTERIKRLSIMNNFSLAESPDVKYFYFSQLVKFMSRGLSIFGIIKSECQ